jgi:ADP-heptose:LPS heptosyltransferase
LLPGGRDVRCRHRGLAARRAGPLDLDVFACARHGECTATAPVPGLVSCPWCADYEAGPVLQIEVTAFGIGDHILALTAAAGLRHDHPQAEIVLACKPWHRPWAELFSDARCVDRPLSDVLTFRPHTSYEMQMVTRLARPRWEHYARLCGTTARAPTPAPLPRQAVEWARPYAGRVALVPFSTFGIRTWDAEHWLGLEALLLARGLTCVVLDDRRGRTDAFRSDKVLGEPVGRVAAVLHAAACAVGNDSGMAHLAAALGRPTVVVCGSWPGEQIFGIYRDVRVINGPWSCSGCCENPLDQERVGCRKVCFSLQAVAPAEVLAAVESAVSAAAS